jgi:hypothetical protein
MYLNFAHVFWPSTFGILRKGIGDFVTHFLLYAMDKKSDDDMFVMKHIANLETIKYWMYAHIYIYIYAKCVLCLRKTNYSIVKINQTYTPDKPPLRQSGLGCWDHGFEYSLRHGCLSSYFCVVLSCVGRGLCEVLITHPKESYRVSKQITKPPVWGRRCTLQGL